MIKVKVKTNERIKFTIPIPYSIMNIFLGVLTSDTILQQINKKIPDKRYNVVLSSKDKKMIYEVIRTMKEYKGVCLVNVKISDGTEVKVEL